MPHRQRHDPSKSLVGFVVGEIEYAVEIARVREIANPLALVPLPHAPRAVARSHVARQCSPSSLPSTLISWREVVITAKRP